MRKVLFIIVVLGLSACTMPGDEQNDEPLEESPTEQEADEREEKEESDMKDEASSPERIKEPTMR